jgi:hypothetical protein
MINVSVNRSRQQQERLSQRDNRAVIILRYQVQAAASWGPRIGATAVGFSEIFKLPSLYLCGPACTMKVSQPW